MLVKLVVVCLVLLWNTDCEARRGRQRGRNRQRHRHHHGDAGTMNRKDLLLSHAANDFGISLYKELASDQDNLVLAPLSALTTMSMLMLGAEGETEENLFQGLKLTPLRRARKAHRAFKRFTRSLEDNLQNVTLESANAMFVRPGEPINRRFKKKIRKYYAGESRDFELTHPQGPEAPINEWVESKTHGMIQDFLQPGAIVDNTLMWLLNAVYFKGTWDWIFEESRTSQRPFTTMSNEEVQVDTMRNDYSYATKYNQQLQVKVLELPYIGNRFSFFILLPDAVGLTSLKNNLDYESLEGLLTNLSLPSRYIISIPKFKIESSLNLIPPLQALGVSNVFDRYNADLSGINGGRNLFVDGVKQKAVLEVNERGTIAAAVTGVRVSVTSLPPEFKANRPFMYVLRDKTTSTNLFIGHVVHPQDAN